MAEQQQGAAPATAWECATAVLDLVPMLEEDERRGAVAALIDAYADALDLLAGHHTPSTEREATIRSVVGSQALAGVVVTPEQAARVYDEVARGSTTGADDPTPGADG